MLRWEPGGDKPFSRAIAFIEDYGQALLFTPWHRLEVRNAIRLAVWQKLYSRSPNFRPGSRNLTLRSG